STEGRAAWTAPGPLHNPEEASDETRRRDGAPGRIRSAARHRAGAAVRHTSGTGRAAPGVAPDPARARAAAPHAGARRGHVDRAGPGVQRGPGLLLDRLAHDHGRP